MYPNGQVPRGLLVERPSAGKSNCLMMPGTAAKHDRLVALAQAEYGWTPRVSGPNDGYRTLDAQWYYYRNEPPGMAAYPGTSSHGGTYNGQEAGAVDYGNWGQVGVNAFFDLARRAGFEPGYFMGQHGRPYEPWHIIDWTPWDVPAVPETPITLEDIVGLKSIVIYCPETSAGTAYDFESGFRTSWSSNPSYAQGMGNMAEGGTIEVTPSHYDQISSDFDAFFSKK